MQILKFASPNASHFYIFRYKHVGIGKAKLWHWVSKPIPVPNMNGFASQWNTGLKPIFHWITGSNANEIDRKKVKCSWPTPKFCVGTQRNLYSTGLRSGFASGKTQLLGFASGKTPVDLCRSGI